MELRPAWLARLRRISGIFLFLALTGLVPLLAPYGVFSQWILLLHILIGLLAALPLAVLFFRHGAAAGKVKPTRWNSSGLWAGLGWLVLSASGLWLVACGVWGTFTPYRLHYVHLALGLGLGAIGVAHLALGTLRSEMPQRRYRDLAQPLAIGGLIAAIGLSSLAYARHASVLANINFLPSNARTTTGKVVPAELLRGSESCGASGCHRDIYRQWEPAAHRFSGMDPFYETVKRNYLKAGGPDSPRYCAGCHEPVTLLTGQHILVAHTGDSESGSSCAFCHAVRDAETRGNANYALRPPLPYLFQLSSNPALRRVSWMLLRLHPEQHRLDFDVRPSQSAEFCGACHKQFINKATNGWGFVQLQNQYDDWKTGPWHSDARRNLLCQSCHMPQVRSDDPGRNAQGFIHDHRILAANNFVPEMLGLPGAGEQTRLVNDWLAGRTVIPEIAKVWPAGPILALDLLPDGPVVPGHPAKLRVLVTNRKVGHSFPTGPLDVIQAWLEVEVSDANAHPVFSVGALAPDGSIQGQTVQWRSYLLNRDAHPVFDHALWYVVGARDKRVIPPGGSDSTEFEFPTSRNLVGPLRCRVKLLYRKFNFESRAVLFEPGKVPNIPVVEIANTTRDLPLEAPGAKAPPVRIATASSGHAVRRLGRSR